MKRDIAKRWVDALRSGKFPQTKGRLHRLEPTAVEPQEYPAGYCCLGVLCELAVADGVITSRLDVKEPVIWYGNAAGSALRLPQAVQDWAGMKGDGSTYLNEDGQTDGLILLNDFDDWDFNQIADVIEAHVDQL